MAATFFISGNSLSNSFTFSVKCITLSSLSVLFSVVRSMQLNRNFFTSGVLFAGTFSAMILAACAAISASSSWVLYFARAASYLLWVAHFSPWSFNLGLLICLVWSRLVSSRSYGGKPLSGSLRSGLQYREVPENICHFILEVVFFSFFEGLVSILAGHDAGHFAHFFGSVWPCW